MAKLAEKIDSEYNVKLTYHSTDTVSYKKFDEVLVWLLTGLEKNLTLEYADFCFTWTMCNDDTTYIQVEQWTKNKEDLHLTYEFHNLNEERFSILRSICRIHREAMDGL